MADLIRGMDVSSYFEMKDKGVHYYDEAGQEVDVLEYAVKRGFNFARTRLWNEPEKVPESGGYCNLEKTIQLAKRFAELGIGFVLDFHYSDFWADPGAQRKPDAWKDLSVDELEEAVYQYTKDCLNAMDEAGVYPTMVQVGNEIRCGILFPDGMLFADEEKFPGAKAPNWENLARFLNAGIRAVRDTQKGRGTKVILHLDHGGNHGFFKDFFDNIIENGVRDFDVIGLSYYPFWHGTFDDFEDNLDKLVDLYGKELLIMETAYAFRRSESSFFGEELEKAAGYPASEDSQKAVLERIIGIISDVKENKGLGYIYWEPFVRMPEESIEWGTCMALMDENGRPTKGYEAVKYQKKVAK